MLERPRLFQAFIASSPAAGYAGDWLFRREEAFVKTGQKLAAKPEAFNRGLRFVLKRYMDRQAPGN
jgi:hypothetical protein